MMAEWRRELLSASLANLSGSYFSDLRLVLLSATLTYLSGSYFSDCGREILLPIFPLPPIPRIDLLNPSLLTLVVPIPARRLTHPPREFDDDDAVGDIQESLSLLLQLPLLVALPVPLLLPLLL